MSTTSIAPLSALVDLIQDSVKVVISQYDAVGQTVPSLDSVNTGPFDTPNNVTPELRQAVEIIEAACAQLTFSVAIPGHVITNKAYAFEESVCMRIVTEAKISDILLNEPGGLHINILAKQSGLDAGKLERVMRLLVTKHCFQEVKPNVFANNRLSVKLSASDPVSGLVGHMTDEAFKGSAYLGDTLADPKSGSSSLPQDAAFRRAHGCSVFEYYDTPEGREKADRFAQAMVGWADVTGRGMLPKVYPWASLPLDPLITICDVGGGNGHATLDLVKAFPHFKVVLQDLPGVIEQGKEYWAKELPSAVHNQMVEFVPIDMFKDIPVASCDFYYIRHVLHDWPYAECLTILHNVRKAMKPASRLLIHELVLQYQTRDQAQENMFMQAPEPLLANYGMARVRIYQQDINMMSSLNSKERTLQEFIDMGKEAGFEFVKVWDSGESGIVEFVLA